MAVATMASASSGVNPPCPVAIRYTAGAKMRSSATSGSTLGSSSPRATPRSQITIDREVPKDLTIHLIVDNYATHKHPTVGSWLDKHPRFQLHFTPTSSSWLNLVERWFRELTDKALRRGVFHSVPDLIASIEEYLNAHNDDPRPYVWTATAESILAKVASGRIALEKVS
jgi:transposase